MRQAAHHNTLIMKTSIGIGFFALWGSMVFAQTETMPTIKNGSFEGKPHDAIAPEGWESCGYDSTPDILPGPWGVYQKPTHGNTFLGLITREDNSWEMVYQKLERPLLKDHCYKIKLDLARSPAYAGYAGATCLRIWGGTAPCEKKVKLATSPAVEHYEWKTYELILIPDQDIHYLFLECYYKEPTLFPYRGNILIDFIQPLEPCDRA